MSTGPRIYNLFPSLVGPIARWETHVERIAAMNFDWMYLNPLHETGYSGSLYAVKNYYRLNPLFRGTATASDDELIAGFTAAAGAAGISVMMDLVVNHTARDADLTREHPGWYRRAEDGSIESPSANDPANPSDVTVWTDLAELDYRERPQRAEMVAYFSEVVRHYTRLGIAGFRCDAAYKVPSDVWAAYIAAAREIRPDALFAAETLGAPLRKRSRGCSPPVSAISSTARSGGIFRPAGCSISTSGFGTSRRRSRSPKATTPPGWRRNWPAGRMPKSRPNTGFAICSRRFFPAA